MIRYSREKTPWIEVRSFLCTLLDIFLPFLMLLCVWVMYWCKSIICLTTPAGGRALTSTFMCEVSDEGVCMCDMHLMIMSVCVCIKVCDWFIEICLIRCQLTIFMFRVIITSVMRMFEVFHIKYFNFTFSLQNFAKSNISTTLVVLFSIDSLFLEKYNNCDLYLQWMSSVTFVFTVL